LSLCNTAIGLIVLYSLFSGSSANNALGLSTLVAQQKHFNKAILKLKEKEMISEDLKLKFAHGTSNEINAMATLLSKVMPVYQPQNKLYEVGSYVEMHNEQLFFISSPDGEGRYNDKPCDATSSRRNEDTAYGTIGYEIHLR
jgi:hypothetical protein